MLEAMQSSLGLFSLKSWLSYLVTDIAALKAFDSNLRPPVQTRRGKCEEAFSPKGGLAGLANDGPIG